MKPKKELNRYKLREIKALKKSKIQNQNKTTKYQTKKKINE